MAIGTRRADILDSDTRLASTPASGVLSNQRVVAVIHFPQADDRRIARSILRLQAAKSVPVKLIGRIFQRAIIFAKAGWRDSMEPWRKSQYYA